MAPRIVVTGASGFIGRYVVRELLAQGATVIAVTRGKSRLAEFAGQARIVEMDLAIPGDRCFDRLGQPDVLLHLAWDGLPNYRSLRHFEQELPSQYAFLRQMVAQGLKSMVVTGTCFEYGMQSGRLAEDTETQPANPYGFAKNVLRQQLAYLKQQTPFNLTWPRLFYMYGDGQPATSLLPQLKKAVGQGEGQFNMSGGEQLRDYLPVGEVARLLVALALQQQDHGPVNVCSGKPQSVRSLVERWIRENRWDIKLNLSHYPYPDYEPMAFWGNHEKLEACLKYDALGRKS